MIIIIEVLSDKFLSVNFKVLKIGQKLGEMLHMHKVIFIQYFKC